MTSDYRFAYLHSRISCVALALLLCISNASAQELVDHSQHNAEPMPQEDHTDHSQHNVEPAPETNHADHSAHETEAMPQAAQSDGDHAAHKQDMSHETMVADVQSESAILRSPHAYSGGYTRESGLYALPVNDQHSLMDEEKFTRLLVNRFENVDTDTTDVTRYDIQLWYGKTYNRFVLKAEGELEDSSLEDGRTELLWSRATSRFWDTQLGMRFDSGDGPQRSWLAAGIQGLAPYWFDVHATVFIGESGRTALGFEAEYEGRITQRLSVEPRIDMNVYGKDDPARGRGAGLSDLTLGLRMQYQFTRQFVPYIGIERIQRFGETADLLPAGLDDVDSRFVAGLEFWF